jgi:hypothetical protein
VTRPRRGERAWCGHAESSGPRAGELYLRRDIARAGEKGTVRRERRRGEGVAPVRAREGRWRDRRRKRCRGMGKGHAAVRKKRSNRFLSLNTSSGG